MKRGQLITGRTSLGREVCGRVAEILGHRVKIRVDSRTYYTVDITTTDVYKETKSRLASRLAQLSQKLTALVTDPQLEEWYANNPDAIDSGALPPEYEAQAASLQRQISRLETQIQTF